MLQISSSCFCFRFRFARDAAGVFLIQGNLRRFGGVLLVFSFACGGTAEISRDLQGLALDSAGQPIAGAKVHVGAQDTVTDAVGHFSVASAPGLYDATA